MPISWLSVCIAFSRVKESMCSSGELVESPLILCVFNVFDCNRRPRRSASTPVSPNTCSNVKIRRGHPNNVTSYFLFAKNIE